MKIYKESPADAYPAIQVLPDSTTTPAGYVEVIDIEEAYTYGLSKLDPSMAGWCDKLSFRTKLKTMVYTKMQVAAPADVSNQTNWDYLTVAEKKIATELFLVGRESFFLEVENDMRVWTLRAGEYRTWSQQARECRAALAESILFMRMLNLSESKLVLADLHQIALDTVINVDDITKKITSKVIVKKLNDMYVEGLEDLEHDGVVAVKDWIQSTVGTPFENNGFMNLGYAFEGAHTAASVRDELLAALDGTY